MGGSGVILFNEKNCPINENNRLPVDLGTGSITVEANMLTQEFPGGQITINSTATLIPSSALSGRKVLVLQNNGTQDVRIGSSTVTFNGGGYLLRSGGGIINIDCDDGFEVYGIVASGTETLDYNEGI